MYLANRQLQHNGRIISRGEPLPDAHTWHNIERLVRRGWVVIDPAVVAKAAELVAAERAKAAPTQGANPAPKAAPAVPEAPTKRKPMKG